MANGVLIGTYQSKNDFGNGNQGFRLDIQQYSDKGIKKTNELLKVINKIGIKHNASSAQILIAGMINNYDFSS